MENVNCKNGYNNDQRIHSLLIINISAEIQDKDTTAERQVDLLSQFPQPTPNA